MTFKCLGGVLTTMSYKRYCRMIWSLWIRNSLFIRRRLKRAIKKHAVQLVNQKLISEKLAKYFTSL